MSKSSPRIKMSNKRDSASSQCAQVRKKGSHKKKKKGDSANSNTLPERKRGGDSDLQQTPVAPYLGKRRKKKKWGGGHPFVSDEGEERRVCKRDSFNHAQQRPERKRERRSPPKKGKRTLPGLYKFC